MPAGKSQAFTGCSKGVVSSLPPSLPPPLRPPPPPHNTRSHPNAQNEANHSGSCGKCFSATHISESVPGSVLVELSHGAQPFVVAVTGDRRFSAQQESHDR